MLGGALLFSDVDAAEPVVAVPGRTAITGRVVLEHDALKVDYRHPVTRQRVRAPIYPNRSSPEVGGRIRVVVDDDDPMSATIEGDSDVRGWENALLYGAFVVLAAIPLVFRRFQLWRSERLAASGTTSFAMHGALFGSHFGRAHLALYALDAAAGAPPVCSVRVLTTAFAPQAGTVFPVEVKGSPRPLGRVVASFGNGVLWPAGPATARRGGHGRPARVATRPAAPEAVTNPRLRWSPAPWRLLGMPAAALGAALVFGAIVTVVTLRDAAASDHWFGRAERTVGEVVGKSGEDSWVAVRYGSRDKQVSAHAPVIYDSDFHTGIKYPIRVDRDDPSHIRLESEPYDRTGPIPWGLLPAMLVLPWGAHRVVAWFRVRRAVRRGPWHRVEAAYAGMGPFDCALVRVGADGHVLAELQLSPERLPRGERFELVVAGELEPGGAAATWYEREPVAPAGLVIVAESPALWDEDHDEVADEWLLVDDGEARSEIGLKTFPLSRRKPRFEVGHDKAVLTLRNYFTGSWTIPTGQLAAVDLTRSDLDCETGPEALQTPYLQTTGNIGSPSLMLLFKTPQRVPPVRLSTALAGSNGVNWGYRASRSPEGAWADGIQLRAKDPAAAVRALAAAGAAAPRQPTTWLREARPELWRRELVEAVRSTARRQRNFVLAGGLVFAVGAGLLFVTPEDASGWVFMALIAMFTAGLGLMFASSLLVRRRR